MVENVELVVDARAELGEGPLWDALAQRLYWVNILGHTVHALDPASGATESVDVGYAVGAAAMAADDTLLLAIERGFALLDWPTHTLTLLAAPGGEPDGTRFNDGKVDPAGRFWAGTMPWKENAPIGSVYRLERDGSIRHMLGGVTVSNGLAWSADGLTLYYIDTPTHVVSAFDIDSEPGGLLNRRTVVAIPAGEGAPDGMTIDSEGMLWVAHWGGAQVSRWNPASGEQLGHISVPATQVTSCCFGGAALDELYITTARTGLSDAQLADQPLAGGIFRARPGVVGTAMTRYGG